MGILATLALAAFFVWTLRRLRRADARIRALEQRVAALAPVAAPSAAGPGEPARAPTAAGATSAAAPVAPPPRATNAWLETLARLSRRWRVSAHWHALERQLIENWTGILGAVLLVAGVAFLGIYTALFLGPELRTAMIAAAAAALAAGYVFLRERQGWRGPAAWLRSSAAALFLFACFGAVAVDGLRWIDGAGPALSVLALGIAANLWLARAAGSERFAALHTVLGLVPLAIVPPGAIPFALATGVALFGVVLAHRARWDVHLGLTLAAFGLFQLDSVLGLGDALDEPRMRALGVGGSVAVAAAAALVHYGREYRTPDFERLPFVVHLLNWALLGASLSVYTRAPWRGLALFAAAGAAWWLARRARVLGVRWAHLLDTLIAQGLIVAGLVSFYPLVPNSLALLVAIFAQSALYTRVVAAQQEPIFDRVGIYLLQGSAVLLCVEALTAFRAPAAERTQDALLLVLAAAIGMVRHHWFVRERGEGFDSLSCWGMVGEYLRSEFVRPLSRGSGEVSLLGVLIGALLGCAYPLVHEMVWGPALAAGSVALAAGFARWSNSSGLTIGAALALLAAHATVFGVCLFDEPDPARSAAFLSPMLAASLATRMIASGGPWAERLGLLAVYLAGADLALAAQVLLAPASPLLPAVGWLSLSLVALELAQRLPARDAGALLHVGYASLLLFAGAYVLVGMQSTELLGPLPARAWLEAFALGCLVFWWRTPARGAVAQLGSFARVQPFFLEASLLLVTCMLALASAPIWRPALFCGLALLLPLASGLPGAERLRFWALVSFWGSGLDLIAVTGLVETPSRVWYRQPATAGLTAIALQVAFVVRAQGRFELRGLAVPRGLGALARVAERVAEHRALWIYTPIFLCVAVFLYWRFDHAVLTLLWAAEAFVVFALAAWLRENSFRQLALLALGACLVRLVVYDLEQSGTLMRGLVFLGVGVLMLGMNSIYARFRSRFQ